MRGHTPCSLDERKAVLGRRHGISSRVERCGRSSLGEEWEEEGKKLAVSACAGVVHGQESGKEGGRLCEMIEPVPLSEAFKCLCNNS